MKQVSMSLRAALRIVLVLALALSLMVTAFPMAVAAESGDTSGAPVAQGSSPPGDDGGANVAVMEKDGGSIVIDIGITDVLEEQLEAAGETFQALTVEGYAYTSEVGKPQLPAVRETIGIPDGATVQATVLDASYTARTGYKVYPVQEPEVDSGEPTDFAIDAQFYSQDAFYPAQIVEVGSPAVWRDVSVVDLQVNPVTFNPATGELRVYDRIQVQLDYSGGVDAPKTVEPQFASMYRSTILNYDMLGIAEANLDFDSTPATDTTVVTPDGLELDGSPYVTSVKILSLRHSSVSTFSTLRTLLDWHKESGLPYDSYYYSGTPTAAGVKSFIDSYYSSHPELLYVLLVGDIDYIPWQSSWNGQPGDYWYACLTGGATPDLYPEVAVGRLTVESDAELQQQIDKILEYETSPPAGSWVDRALLVAHKENAPGKYQGAKEEIRTATYSDSPIFYTAYGAAAAQGGDDATNADVSTAINTSHRGIVNYRGHGSPGSPSPRPWGIYWGSNWNTSNEEYRTTQAAALTNGDYTPVVFSISCLNNALDNTAECLGEAFVKHDDGAVAFLGASRPSYTVPNHEFDKDLFDAFGNEGIYNIGWILNDANSELVNRYGSGSVYTDNARMYLWLGDPAMELRTAGTRYMTATYPATIQNSITVTVKDTASNLPLANALVCLSKGGDIYTWSYTSGSGQATFVISPSSDGSMKVTVTKHNYYPHQGTTTIDTTAPSVTLIDPNGGEIWSVGSVHNILWSATDSTDTVASIDLYYSINGGSSYYTIATGEANDGTYPWTIPDTPSTRCRVKAVARDDANFTSEDVSDDDFTIPEANISVFPTHIGVTLPQNTTWDTNLRVTNSGDETLLYEILDIETTGGPYFEWVAQVPDPLPAGQTGVLIAKIDDPDGLADIDQVRAFVIERPTDTGPMYDDGAHGDGAAGDGVYGTSVNGTTMYGEELGLGLEAKDLSGNVAYATIAFHVDIGDAGIAGATDETLFPDAGPQVAMDTIGSESDPPGAGQGSAGGMDLGNIVNDIPSPDTSPNGLAWDGTYLWSTGHATRTIYKLYAPTGAVLSSIPAPGASAPLTSPSDLAWDGTYLWHTDFGTDMIYRLNSSTGAVITSFAAPALDPEGLAWDGTHLWVGCYDTSTIYRVSTAGVVADSFAAPGAAHGADGLAWDGAYLWISGYDDVIYKCDTSGTVVTSFPTPGNAGNGLAYDGVYLWSDGDLEDKIYQIDIFGAPPDCPWLSEAPDSGSVAQNEYVDVTVTVDTTGLAVGDYTAEIYVTSNDRDETPTIVPVQLAVVAPIEAGLIAFDETHSPSCCAPGYYTTSDIYADWVNLLEAWGFTVTTLTQGPITYEVLQPYCAVVIAEPTVDYSDAENAAIQQYVDAGGGLLVLGEWGPFATGAIFPVVNELATPFGMSFNDDTVRDGTNNDGRDLWPLIPDFDNSVVGADVDEVVEYAGCSVNAEAPAFPIAWGYGSAHTDMDSGTDAGEADGAGADGAQAAPAAGTATYDAPAAEVDPAAGDAATAQTTVSVDYTGVIDGLDILALGSSIVTHDDLEVARLNALGANAVLVEDATIATLTAFDLQWFDVVYLPLDWGRSSTHIEAIGSALQGFVNGGGGLVVGQCNTFTAPYTPAFLPAGYGVTYTDSSFPACGVTILDPSHFITDGLLGDDMPDLYDRVSTSSLGASYSLLAQSSVEDMVSLAVAEYGTGRIAVHTSNWKGTGTVCTDDPDIIIERVLCWAAQWEVEPPVMAASFYGDGRAMVIGDGNLFSDFEGDGDGVTALFEYDNEKLAVNIIDWLCIGAVPERKPDLVITRKYEEPASPQIYLHPEEPIMPPRPIERPIGLNWRELYPNSDRAYNLADWKDNGDRVLSPSDNVVLIDLGTEEKDVYHVDDVTITMIARPELGRDVIFDFTGGYELVEKAMAVPEGTFWHEIVPTFCRDYRLVAWADVNADKVLSAGDTVDMALAPIGKPVRLQVREVSWDIIVSPVEAGESYVVCYTVRNQGTATAAAGHYTSLTVDGSPVETKFVPVALAPGESFSDCFRTVVTCTPPEDKVLVCADSTGVVDELNERNNCLGNIYSCCEPSIEVVKQVWDPQTKEWVENITAGLGDTVRFRCTVHNNGTCCDLTRIVASDILSESLEYANRATVNGEPWEPVQVSPIEFTWEFPGWVLKPSQSIVIEFDAVVVGCGEDVNLQRAQAVCVDTGEVVRDSDTATVTGADLPDLVITKIRCDRANNRIGYEVTNLGCDTAPEGHTTALWVGGVLVDKDMVLVDLAHGESYESWFPDYEWPFCETLSDVRVCADGGNDVAESDESNNCKDGGCISAALEWTWNSTKVEPDYDQVMMAPVAADLNGDDVPDVIFSTFKGSNYTSDGILRAISGADGSELFSVINASYRVKPGAEPAVADIDNDGLPEILVSKDTGEVICFENDGAYKWTSASAVGRLAVAVADLNEDGTPEIVAGKTVFNNDGTVRWTGTAGSSYASVVADLDLSGRPEVVAGTTAYRYDGTISWTSSHGGKHAIGNFDDDANPEIVTVGSNQVSLKEHDGTIKWGPVAMPGDGGNGPPVVADVDGDGELEIGVGGARHYVLFETDGTIKWMADIVDTSSRAAGSSAFDFDKDGSAEIIYSDHYYHRIFRGVDGAVLFETPGPSGTLCEQPIILDVDNDGHVEIVFAVNNYAFSGNTGIEAWGNDECWPEARCIWNQHTYHITNIRDDATVPQFETNNWAVFNNYRAQSPYSCCEPSIELVKKVWDECAQEWVDHICGEYKGTVRFQITVHNDGTCCDLSRIAVTDILSESLEYADRATVNGEPWEPTQVAPGEFVWTFTQWVLPPSNRIVIEFDAVVVQVTEEPDVNTATVTAWCERTQTQVSDGDRATVQPYIPGDANMDGIIDGRDVIRAKKIILGLEPPTCGADANGDCLIDGRDVIRIKKIILGVA
jgi:uncharacterized repeat protein (TIGR01451 family)